MHYPSFIVSPLISFAPLPLQSQPQIFYLIRPIIQLFILQKVLSRASSWQ